MDELKVFVDLKPLTDEDIKAKNFGLADLWMVKIEGKDPYGPYDTESLKDYAAKYQFLFEEAKVYNLDSDQWYEMFSVPQFQRRKPQLVSAQNLIQTQEFYILYNGQKDGPHTQAKIQQLLELGHILPSTQVSLDNGQSWIKLYEHHAFDRRTKKSNQELPFKPNEEVLDKVKSTKEQILKLKEAEDAIVQFAYMGHGEMELDESDVSFELEPKKKVVSHNPLSNEEIVAMKKLKKIKRDPKTSAEESGGGVWKYAATFVIAIALTFGYFNWKKTDPKKTVSEMNVKEAQTSTSSIDNSERQVINKPDRTPASLRDQNKPKVQQIKRTVTKPRRVQPQRAQRFVKKKTPLKQVFEQDIERIDINDPEVQDELNRQLAGEYDEEPEREDKPEEEPYEKEAEAEHNPYDTEEQQQPIEEDPYAKEDALLEQDNY